MKTKTKPEVQTVQFFTQLRAGTYRVQDLTDEEIDVLLKDGCQQSQNVDQAYAVRTLEREVKRRVHLGELQFLARLSNSARIVGAACLLLLTACEADVFVRGQLLPDGAIVAEIDGGVSIDGSSGDSEMRDANGGNDSSTDAFSDTSTCTPENGKVACKAVVDAWCLRFKSCMDAQACAAYAWNVCNDVKFQKSVCVDTANACIAAWNEAQCSDALVGEPPQSVPKPACPTFWGQF